MTFILIAIPFILTGAILTGICAIPFIMNIIEKE